MSLYYETAPYLSSDETFAPLKSRLFDSTKEQIKSSPKQIYALASETALWSPVLAEVIGSCKLLDLERKLSPELALLLTHDLLLTQRGISAPTSHVLRQAVERHKARLNAEFVKARLRRGCSTFDQLRETLKEEAEHPKTVVNGASEDGGLSSEALFRPRWVRINTCKTSIKEQLDTTFKHFVQVQNLQDLPSCTTKAFHIDKHIPNLIALRPSTEITKSPAYTSGLLIFQDKASCFPAYLLNPSPVDGDIVDACAAPGNKTTHLAAILQEKSLYQQASNKTCTIHACERDTTRALVLQNMTTLASSRHHQRIKIHAGQDFLDIDPHTAPWNTITSLLLDPSCSGSGIIGRDDSSSPLIVTLPQRRTNPNPTPTTSKTGKKRKRKPNTTAPAPKSIFPHPIPKPLPPTPSLDDLTARLASLQAFQLRLVLHAFTFPLASRVSYSTCSIHAQENEHVVVKALTSQLARTRGWRVLRREEQIEGMKAWGIRGVEAAVRDVADAKEDKVLGEMAEGCLRCEKGTEEGTQGFFVVGFVRDERAGGTRARVQGALEDGDCGQQRSQALVTDDAAEEGDGKDEEWEGFAE